MEIVKKLYNDEQHYLNLSPLPPSLDGEHLLNSPSKDGGNGDKYGESAIEIHLKMDLWSIVFIIFVKKTPFLKGIDKIL